MANPFSGLENIGASYMAGARLAQDRQRRADEIAARQEEARIRQQYYQDIIAEREAARLATAGEREAQGATLFGKYLVRKADGTIDYQASQAARQAGESQGRFAEATGMLAGEGEPTGPISPEIMASPEYAKGRATTLGKRLGETRAMRRSLMGQGYVPVDEPQPQPFGFSADILAQPRDTSEDIVVDGQRFQPTPIARKRAMPTAAKAPNLGTETVDLPGGGKARIPITPERSAAIAAQMAAAAPKEPGPFDDIDAAVKQLQTLQDRGIEDFNITRNKEGAIEVIEDQPLSMGQTADEIIADLNLERKRRAERRGIKTAAGAAPGAVPAQQGTNRVINVLEIPGLRPLPGR